MSAFAIPRVAGGTEETFLMVSRSVLAASMSATETLVKALEWEQFIVKLRAYPNIAKKFEYYIICYLVLNSFISAASTAALDMVLPRSDHVND